jgi:S-DNA-T family DNA segregation ATPase FtsK/SpoIIIE
VVDQLRLLRHDDSVLLVVDDADLVHDDRGELASLLADRRPHLHVVAAGRADSLRADYGHWTTAVRRSRMGLLLGAVHELDADLLGIVLRRRRDEPPKPPGRGHLVAAGVVEELHVAAAGQCPWPSDRDQEEPALVGPPALLGSAGQRCLG